MGKSQIILMMLQDGDKELLSNYYFTAFEVDLIAL